MATLRGNKIKDTYNKIVQVNGNNELQDGLGNLLTGSLGLSGSLILSGSQTIGGDLTVGGNVTAQKFIATTVSSSIIYESGSSAFGNSSDDIHIFTGSILLEGSQSISGPLTLGTIQDVSSSIDSISTSITTLSGSAHSQRVALIDNLSGSTHIQREVLVNILSSSAHIQREALISNLSASVDSHLDSNILALSSSANLARRSEISDLSGSAHIQRLSISASLANSIISNTSDVSTLSGSAHTQRVAISSSLKNYTDTKISDLVGGAPALLDTLNEIATAIGDDAAISASFASTLSTKASITQLNASSSALIANINSATASLSSSAHIQRVALDSNQSTALSDLSASIDSLLETYNAPTATSASYALTASHALNVPATASYAIFADNALSSSYALTASHALNVPATASYAITSSYSISGSHAISSSYALTASFALNVSEGTGFPFTGSAIITGSLEVIGGTITGDGSGITNIGIDAQTSHFESFTNQTSLNINHGLGSKNVIVTVYNSSDELIVPASIITSDSNNVGITFDVATTGRVGVTRGGHIISQSTVNYGFIQLSADENHSSGSNVGYTSGLTLVASNNITLDGTDIILPSGSTYKLEGMINAAVAEGDVNQVRYRWFESGSLVGVGSTGYIRHGNYELNTKAFAIIDATSVNKKVALRYTYKDQVQDFTYEADSSVIFIEALGVTN